MRHRVVTSGHDHVIEGEVLERSRGQQIFDRDVEELGGLVEVDTSYSCSESDEFSNVTFLCSSREVIVDDGTWWIGGNRSTEVLLEGVIRIFNELFWIIGPDPSRKSKSISIE